MENVRRKKKRNQPFPRWLRLSLYKNCFGENDGNHLGLRFRGVFYCITHSSGNGVIIPKKALRMREISTKLEYLKVCKAVPEILHVTNMYIDKSYLVKAILENVLNK